MSFFGPPVYALAAALFALGVLGFLIRRNAIMVLMSIELMLNAANLTFLAGARGSLASTTGRGTLADEASCYAIFVILVAAAEAAVGLALVLALFRAKRTLDVEAASDLRG